MNKCSLDEYVSRDTRFIYCYGFNAQGCAYLGYFIYMAHFNKLLHSTCDEFYFYFLPAY